MSTVDPSLSNRDLRPTTPERRTWGFYNYTALWFSMCMEITTYQLASSLIAKGMDWKQAIGTVLLGNLIVLVPMLLNAHAGAKYGIPFPVFIRAPFGVRGANLAAILRAVVACGWFGIQSWIGGSAIDAMLAVIWPGAAGSSAILWVCFLGFWLLNMVVVWRGVESIRHLQAFGAPFMFVMAAALLIWVRMKAGSFGTMLSTPSAFHSTHEFLAVFFPSLTAMVGYWATLALNIPDFTRYSKSQSAQSWGQAFGLPVAMVLYTFVGIAVTSASTVLFGHAIWNPIALIGAFHQPVVAFIALVAILVATLNVNIGANVVSPSNDFSNLYPANCLESPGSPVSYYFKFPGTFKIQLPKMIGGNYNPDWGIYVDTSSGKTWIVRETKGNEDILKLRFSSEARKIVCGYKYFRALGIDYRAIRDDTTDWPDPTPSEYRIEQ